MLCTMCMHGTTDTWRCQACGETNCRHMLHECGDCKAPKRPNGDVSLTLALHNGLVVGCVTSAAYQGHESSWPKGFGELIDKLGSGITLIGVDGVDVEAAWQMIAAYEPARLAKIEMLGLPLCAECGMPVGQPHLPPCGKRVIGCPNVVIDDCGIGDDTAE